MRRLVVLFVLIFIGYSMPLVAQYDGAPNGLSIKVLASDYYSPAVWSDKITGLGSFNDDASEAIDQIRLGMEVGYTRYLTNKLNLQIPVRIGTVDYLGLPENLPFNRKSFFASIDVLAQLKLLDSNKFINPYLVAGVGGTSVFNNDITAQGLYGGGFEFRVNDHFFVQLQSEMRHQFSEDKNNHLHHTLGCVFLFKSKTQPINTDKMDVKPVDTDGDGVADKDDACPNIAGEAALGGCPDTDGDGIADKDDSCPSEAGTVANNGCPEIKDTDGDGIVDENDKCPNIKGIAMFGGCPDTDNDGIEDARDKCPTIAGIVSNSGCPEIKKEDKEILVEAMEAVEFETGKDVIRSVSYPILNKIVDIMARYPDYSLRIGGHTDSVGASDSNQKLSEQRAKACYNYMVNKGVKAARMTYIGYGEKKPIADNKYKEGRQKNRRVEFDLYLK